MENVPVQEGLFETLDDGGIRLIADCCPDCGELFFPQRTLNFCSHCHSRNLEKIHLGTRGVVKSFTVVHQQPAGGFYQGAVPFGYGIVELPEKIWIPTLFECDDLDLLAAGLPVELTEAPLFSDEEGRQVVTFKFRPCKA